MQTKQPFSIVKRLQSFSYAFNGLKILIREEHNARVHLLAALVVIAAGFFFQISSNDWLAIVLSIGLVISAEAMNSAIENIADFISPERNDAIKRIKDLGAAAVLICVLTAVVVGLMVFLPKVFLLFL
jgi:undecaprenol kinase/diacylglycerol kinase (ATP)